ncbi:MAG: hypothetical protein JWQ25_3172 [Daejeonella sp.]|nr:hypothetical protein [Daejeonella sp.]
MRIIAELPHPEFKISIFLMNQKYLVKFEKGTYEQTYKLSQIDIPDGVDGVFKLLDADFFESVATRFTQMRADFNNAFQRYELL